MQEASQITWDFKCNAGVLNSTKSCHYKVKRKPVLRRRNNDEGRILEWRGPVQLKVRANWVLDSFLSKEFDPPLANTIDFWNNHLL